MNSRKHHLRQLSSYSAKSTHNNNNKLKGEGLMQKARDLYEKAKKISDEMKDLKLEKKQYETYILGFMDKANKKVIKTN